MKRGFGTINWMVSSIGLGNWNLGDQLSFKLHLYSCGECSPCEHKLEIPPLIEEAHRIMFV